MTRNPDVRFAKSIVDYIFRWMASKFLSPEAQFRAGVNNRDEVPRPEQGGVGGDPRAEGRRARRRSPRPSAPPARSCRRRRWPRCRTRRTRRRARPAGRSWSAADPATSAATAARPAAAPKARGFEAGRFEARIGSKHDGFKARWRAGALLRPSFLSLPIGLARVPTIPFKGIVDACRRRPSISCRSPFRCSTSCCRSWTRTATATPSSRTSRREPVGKCA